MGSTLACTSILGLALMVGACAAPIQTGPSYFNLPKVVPDAKSAVVYIYRYGEVLGYYGASSIRVNQTEMGTLGASGFMHARLPAGRHVISEAGDSQLPHGSRAQLAIDVQNGRTYFVKVDVDVQLEGEKTQPNLAALAVGLPIFEKRAFGQIQRTLLQMDEVEAEKELWFCNYSHDPNRPVSP